MYQINYIAPELQKDTSLSLSARCVLGRIGGLTQRGNKPCYASNEFLANECGLSKRTIQNSLSELEQRKIISTKITLFQGRKTRYIYLSYEPENNSFNSAKHDTTHAKSALLESAKHDKTDANFAISNSAKSAISTIYIEKDNRDHIERDRKTLSIPFDFNSLFSVMNEIKNEFTDHIFTDAEIRENAQSYLDKSQEYKFYKGKVTRNKLKLWLRNSISHNQKEISAQHTPITLAGLQDNKAVNDFEQLKKQILEQENQNLKKDDPIEADFEIIDEHDQNKNAPA